MRASLLALGVCLFGSAVSADTVKATIDCVFVTTCDQNGACKPAIDRRVSFSVEPVDTARHGEGNYIIRYDQVRAEMVQHTFLGPMIWTEGNSDVQILGGSGASTMIWQQMQTGDPVTSVVHFLKCNEAD